MANILIADDQEKIRQMLKSLFEQYDYTVSVAENGKEALNLFRSQTFDLVITDIIMPDMEGIETIRELKKLDPKIKIIAMSGGGSVRAMEYLRMAGMLGALRTIEKPFDVRTMLDAVRFCLED